MTAPSRDEFEAWQANPVTQFVMAGLKNFAEAQATTWFEHAWGGGDLSELVRERMKTRAESYTELANLTIEEAFASNSLPAPPKTEEPE